MVPRPLAETLGIARDDRLAAIGGGGKMTLLEELGMEWARAGGRPVLLPTARIFKPEEIEQTGLRRLVLPQARSVWPVLDVPPGELLLLGRRSERPGLLGSIAADEIDHVVRSARADLLLIKADGARGRSLKAHRENEPVVPFGTTVVLAMAGLDAWGADLGPDVVHRAELFAERWGMRLGERLEDEAFLRPLADPRGYRAAVPAGARYVVFLNKADRTVRRAIAQRLAAALHALGVNDVAFGDVRRGEWALAPRSGR